LLLVSHDRDFLDNVVTSTLVMEGEGQVGEYVGGYSDWLRQRPTPGVAVAARATLAVVPTTATAARAKLSFKDQRELEMMPARIERLETEISGFGTRMHAPDYYQRDAAAINADNAAMASLQADLDAAYQRWEQLEGR
ncbi:MAG: ABC transporter ATP-binding protein, partial [Thermomonas sp.]